MARSTLREVKARKEFPCQVGDGSSPHHITPGQTYWLLAAFRRTARFCKDHKPSDEQVDNFAPKSRSDRAGTQAGQWNDLASDLRSIAEDANSLAESVRSKAEGEDDDEDDDDSGDAGKPEKEPTPEEREKEATEELEAKLASLRQRFEALGISKDELDSLAEEMRTWADNMEAANEGLANSAKHDEVSEAADTLEGIDLDDDLPSFPEELEADALESFAEECEQKADELENAASELEGVSFPGMY